MKNLLFLLLILVGCVSCEKEIDTYEGGSGIYFADGGLFSDTLRVAWGLKNSDVKTQSIQLQVCLYGNTANYDRKFNIEIYSDTDTLSAIEGVDFKAFDTEYVIPANQAEAFIDIDLLRTEDLVKHPKRFVVKLIENPELQFIYTREVAVQIDSVNFKMRDIDYQRVIVMNENFPMPAWWNLYGTKYFGVWSQKKSSLICSVPALWKGLIYNTDAMESAEALLKDFTYSDFEYLRNETPKYALDMEINGYQLKDIAKEIVTISYTSLKTYGKSEERLLEPLMENINKGLTPADIIIDKWENEWNGDISKLVEYSVLK